MTVPFKISPGWALSRPVIAVGLLHPDFRTPTTIVALEGRGDGLHFDRVPAMEPKGTNRIFEHAGLVGPIGPEPFQPQFQIDGQVGILQPSSFEVIFHFADSWGC